MRKFIHVTVLPFLLLVTFLMADVVNIREIYKLPEGTLVEATGVVLVQPNNLMSKTAWIQDQTAGIMLYGNLPSLKIGDVVKVVGKTKLYYGILEILPEKVEVIGTTQVVPVDINKLFEEEAKKGEIND
ncbi:MAG: nucleotide-binding protein, partial [Fervidobacterium pennivorans]